MPSSILLFVPLLAGYLFQRLFYYTRFRAQSLDGYKLVLQSILIGFIFGVLARGLVVYAKTLLIGQSLWAWWTSNISHVEYSGTASLCIVLSASLPVLLNIPMWEVWRRAFMRNRLRARLKQRILRHCSMERLAVWRPTFWEVHGAERNRKQRMALCWATKRQKNQLLLLLQDSASQQRMISISLKSRKFYIGYVKSPPSLDPSETFFRLYVAWSGYRDKDNLQFVKVNDYNLLDGKDPLFVTLPIGDIETAAYFDPDVYSKLTANLASASGD